MLALAIAACARTQKSSAGFHLPDGDVQRGQQVFVDFRCNACHRVIDPLGLALENFDATGKWRVKDGMATVDAAGTLYDGSRIDGPAGLRDAVLRRKEAFLQSFTQSLMTYALGRRVEPADMPTVRKIVRDAARNDYRFHSIVLGIVSSYPFQMRSAAGAAAAVSASR